MYYFLALALLVTLLGCSQDVRHSKLPMKPAHLEWDVSENRDASAFPWFDFDPDYGAIDETAYLVFKFDTKREFEGNVERNDPNAAIAGNVMESRYGTT